MSFTVEAQDVEVARTIMDHCLKKNVGDGEDEDEEEGHGDGDASGGDDDDDGGDGDLKASAPPETGTRR